MQLSNQKRSNCTDALYFWVRLIYVRAVLFMVIFPTEKHFEWRRAPIIVFLLVILNFAVFFIYQSGDDGHLFDGLKIYQESSLLNTEWPIYQSYLEQASRLEALELARLKFNADEQFDLSIEILLDRPFFDFVRNEYPTYLSYSEYAVWLEAREWVNASLLEISTFNLGLIPAELGFLQLFSYQFLHGNILHLIGNVFFLVVCGFAVEAAIGHRLFLLFYLLSGLAGGLLHYALNASSYTPLIGASGAISGVMAMYLAAFRLKKIEFFYWIFIFVGYFRAPALIILPVYLLNELVRYLLSVDVGIAFMAHLGGFISGALLIALTLKLRPSSFDYEYIEESQVVDPSRLAFAEVYKHVENFKFDLALTSLSKIAENKALTFELALLQYHLTKLDKGEHHDVAIETLFEFKKIAHTDVLKLAQVWEECLKNTTIPDLDDLARAGLTFIELEDVHYAESVFQFIVNKPAASALKSALARKLGIIFAKLGYEERSQHYAALAESIPLEGDHGVL